MENKVNLLDLNIEELQELLGRVGQQKFRAKQIFQWLHKGIKNIDDMTNLSKELREKLKGISFISALKIRDKLVSKLDGTTKYLFEMEDGNMIESVLMDYKHGFTACISTQVGCRMGCKFCASTGAGFKRNLSSGEILDQILVIQNDSGETVGNVVLMGIGEPLDNYDNVLNFLRTANHQDGINISYRRITISTCGLVPKILDLAKENMPVNLAISLHAPNDEMRETMMPVNKSYSIDKIIEACKIYTEATKRRITFEYALISGVNDSIDNALELARRIKRMLCHVNLIPVNTVQGVDYRRSKREVIEKFKVALERYGIETTVRRELGEDIQAACGQLRRSSMES